MAEYAVTAIGADQPGIVAAVAAALHDAGGNIEDSAMTILGGHFSIMLLVEADESADELRERLRAATAHLGLTITTNEVGAGHDAAAPTHVLSVYGSDQPGLLAGVTAALAEAGANVTDLETRLLSPGDQPVYAMVIEFATAGVEVDAVADRVAAACAELGVDHTLRAIEAETY